MIATQYQHVTISGLLINNKKEILIIKRSSHDTGAGKWELPGGGLDFGEDPYAALEREFKEECGLDVTAVYPYHVVSFVGMKEDKERQLVRIGFVCRMKDETQDVRISNEHEDYRWLSLQDISSVELTRYMKGLMDTDILEKHIK